MFLDNDAIRLRNKKRNTNKVERELICLEQEEIYNLKDKILFLLYEQGFLESTHYFIQYAKNGKEQKIYISKVPGNDSKITSLVPFHKKTELLKSKGKIGMMKYKKSNTKLTTEKAKQTIEDYIKDADKKPEKSITSDKAAKKNIKKSVFKKQNFKTETKLVDLSKLRVVKNIHKNGHLNPKTYEQKKFDLMVAINENDGLYPKSEAILVRKAKDPEDKRRIVYNIEDGYRRYVISNELSLDKVYVDVIVE